MVFLHGSDVAIISITESEVNHITTSSHNINNVTSILSQSWLYL